MIEGLPFSLLAALCWLGVGVGYQRAGKAGISLMPLGFAVSLCALAGTLPVTPFRLVAGHSWSPVLLLTAVVGVAGILRQTSMLATTRAMSLGHASITWVILQSAMVWPFVFAAVFWKEALSLWQWGGVMVVLIGLCGGAHRKTHAEQGDLPTGVACYCWPLGDLRSPGSPVFYS